MTYDPPDERHATADRRALQALERQSVVSRRSMRRRKSNRRAEHSRGQQALQPQVAELMRRRAREPGRPLPGTRALHGEPVRSSHGGISDPTDFPRMRWATKSWPEHWLITPSKVSRELHDAKRTRKRDCSKNYRGRGSNHPADCDRSSCMAIRLRARVHVQLLTHGCAEQHSPGVRLRPWEAQRRVRRPRTSSPLDRSQIVGVQR